MENASLVFQHIPLWFKIAYTVFVLFIIPIYMKYHGPSNFLWFSDIALFTIAIALWLESSLLASMMAVGVLLPEIAWNIDYFARLFTGKKLLGLSDYMFEKDKPLFLRGISLFHVVIPVVLILLLIILGYDKDAVYWQTLLAWLILPVTYFFTSPEENINLVFGLGSKPQKKIHPGLYLVLLMLFLPLCIYLPSHLLLQWIFA